MAAERDERRRIEALKSLADWGKWAISIQTLSAVGITIAKSAVFSVETWQGRLLLVAVAALLVSIMAATLLVGAIPAAIQHIAKKDDASDTADSIYSYKWQGRIRFDTLAFIEHTAFLVGLLALVVSVALGQHSDKV
ncbi:MAG: hypothetical protein AAGI72_02120 [Pseudomonadota bacterium]